LIVGILSGILIGLGFFHLATKLKDKTKEIIVQTKNGYLKRFNKKINSQKDTNIISKQHNTLIYSKNGGKNLVDNSNSPLNKLINQHI
jgi:hypothetical protein